MRPVWTFSVFSLQSYSRFREEVVANVVGEEVEKEEDGNKMDNWWTDVVAVEGVHQEPAVTAE